MAYKLNNYPVANAVFYRSYSRRNKDKYESWEAAISRSIQGLYELGKITEEEKDLMYEYAINCKSLPSGRWMWCGGTDWVKQPANYYGAYNCTSNKLNHPHVFGWLMDLAMQGCGTGALLEDKYLEQLPCVSTKLNVAVIGNFSDDEGFEETEILQDYDSIRILVGDSRRGWVKSYQTLIDMALDKHPSLDQVEVIIDISNVRKAGKILKGFGGTSNPIKLRDLYPKVAAILNGAYGRKLTAEECCLLADEAAIVVVAGNIRRSASIKQFSKNEPQLKLNLWQQDEEGNWRIDPKRDALRMSNHTRVYHSRPSLEECINAVRLQYESGEGAIQYAPEAIARSNADILNTWYKKEKFLEEYNKSPDLGKEDLASYFKQNGMSEDELENELNHRLSRYGLNPCGK